MATLSTGDQAALRGAVNLLRGGSAYETPFAEDVIDRLAPVAVSSGFVASTGAFSEMIKNHPVSTMIRWVLHIGSH